MKRLIFVATMFVLLANSALAAPRHRVPKPQKLVGEITEIEWGCSDAEVGLIKKIILHSDGTAIRSGRDNSKAVGESFGTCDKAHFAQIAKLVAANFFDLEDSYRYRREHTEFWLRVVRGGKEKLIGYHSGDEPPQLWTIQELVKSMASEIRWQPGKTSLSQTPSPSKLPKIITPQDYPK